MQRRQLLIDQGKTVQHRFQPVNELVANRTTSLSANTGRLLQIAQRFFDRLTLCCGSCFRVVSHVATLLGRGQYGCEFHQPSVR